VSALAENEYPDTLSIADAEQLPHSTIGLMRRSPGIPENCLYYFKINDTIFSALDCQFHAIARSIADPAQFDHRFVMESTDWDVSRAPRVSHKLVRRP
jgi:hypothetical protein